MTTNSGFVVLHRKFTEWEWYNDLPTYKLFLHLILMANHEDKKWRGRIIKRGQRLTSLGHLALESGLSVRQVRTALDKLKTTHELTSESTNNYTVITLSNYNQYQDYDKPVDKRMTNERQTDDKRMTTNNNYNNDNNINNNNNILASSDATEISQFIDSFSGVNPSYKQLFKNKTQRASASNLLNQYGLERLLKLVGRLPQIMSDRYAPQITTPYELETKMAKLLLHLKKPANDKFNVTEL